MCINFINFCNNLEISAEIDTNFLIEKLGEFKGSCNRV